MNLQTGLQTQSGTLNDTEIFLKPHFFYPIYNAKKSYFRRRFFRTFSH